MADEKKDHPPAGSPPVGPPAVSPPAVSQPAGSPPAANPSNPGHQATDKNTDSRPFMLVGRAGGPFSIEGIGFGTKGKLTIGGRVIPTTRWIDRSIKGMLPQDIDSGEIIIQTEEGNRRSTYTRNK